MSSTNIEDSKLLKIEDVICDNFDVESFAAAIMQKSQKTNEHLCAIEQLIEETNLMIKKQVLAHHTDLAEQATSIERLQQCLDTITNHTSQLRLAIAKVKGRMDPLYQKMSTQTRQLRRMHEVCNMVRGMHHIMMINSKLRNSKLLEDNSEITPKDIMQISAYVEELQEITQDTDLNGINSIAGDLALIPRFANKARARATTMLSLSLQKKNAIEAAFCLTALCNLDCVGQQMMHMLSTITSDFCDSFCKIGETNLRAASSERQSDAKQPGSVEIKSGKTTASTVIEKALIWSDAQRWLDHTLVSFAMQIKLLEELCVKNYHPRFPEHDILHFVRQYINSGIENKCNSDVIDQKNWLHEMIWNDVTKKLKQSIDDTMNESVKKILQTEYPKLLKLATESFERIDLCATKKKPSICIREAWKDNIEDVFLTSLNDRLKDVISSAFKVTTTVGTTTQNIGPPTIEETRRFVLAIAQEVVISSFDISLRLRVQSTANKLMFTFLNKCQEMIVTNGDASQIIGRRNAVQQKNAQIVAVLNTANNSLQMHSEHDFADVQLSIDQVIESVLGPLFESIADSIEAIVNTIHDESFDVLDEVQPAQCSLYMRELQQFILRTSKEHLVIYKEHCETQIAQKCKHLAHESVQLFLVHCTLVRPINTQGRLRLAGDFAQFELALEPLNVHMNDELKSDYATLRAVRSALFKKPVDLVHDTINIGKTIPYSLAIQLIISSTEDQLLQSPHASCDWSLARYIDWWRQHSNELERLKILKGCVEAYARSVATQGRTSFDDNYPLLCQLIEAAFKSHVTGGEL